MSRNNSTCITESDSTKCQSPPNAVSDDDLKDGDKTSCVSAHIALSCTAADAILLATTPYASHERDIAYTYSANVTDDYTYFIMLHKH